MKFHLDDNALAELSSILQKPSVQDYILKDKQQDFARNLRGDLTAGWLDNVMERMYNNTDNAPKHLINEATGQEHTVESMVDEYRKKVGLDVIHKSASGDLPLSKKQAKSNQGISELSKQKKNKLTETEQENLIDNIIQYIADHLSSHRGHADTHAIVYNLREKFGESVIEENKARCLEEIANCKSKYDYGDAYSKLPPSLKGDPIKINLSPSQDDNIFENIRERGGSTGR